ncbi:MAG: hypothetical protein IT173_09580 [Acidobacteria bacterium]|nr:hypothetical protein [Acidobacteriota bacterium]
MKNEKYTAGDTIAMLCSGCDEETSHSIQAVTKLGKISAAVCDTCQTSSTFKAGVKTGVAAGNAKAAKAYDRAKRYRKGQAMTHPVFGHGEVTAVLDLEKIDVLFGDRTRRLIHGQE